MNEWIASREEHPRTTAHEEMPQASTGLLVTFALVGAVIGYSTILAPIHEMGHVLAIWLSPGASMHTMQWTQVAYKWTPNAVIAMAGYTSALCVAAALSVRARRRRNIGFSLFWLGYAAIQPVHAWGSSDHYDLDRIAGESTSDVLMLLFTLVVLFVVTRLLIGVIRLYQ